MTWQQYFVAATLVFLTAFWIWIDFKASGRKVYGIKIWWLTVWGIFIYALFSGGFFHV